MKTVAIHLASGFEETEAITIIDVLRRAGLTVIIVSVTGEKQVTGSHQITVQSDELFDEVNYNQVDMLVLPGGMPGAKNLVAHEGLKQQIRNFDQQQKFLAAICAAPLVFGRLNLLRNRRASCYPGFEDELVGAKIVNQPVTVDGHLITSRGVGTALDFALQLTALLAGIEKAEQLAKSMLIDFKPNS